MRYFKLILCLSILSVFSIGCQSAPTMDDDGFTILFNGKDKSGWYDEFNIWRIENGCLVAGDLKTLYSAPSWLYSEKTYRNFELHVEVKLLGGSNKNSGIWYRCRPYDMPDEEEEIEEEEMEEEPDEEGHDEEEQDRSEFVEVELVSKNDSGLLLCTGYESDLFYEDDPKEPLLNYWGTLHDSYRRDLRVVGDQSRMDDVINYEGWNHFVIRAEGNRLQHWINGYQVIDYVDNDPTGPREGKIGLQVYWGGPQQVFYRNIRIKEL